MSVDFEHQVSIPRVARSTDWATWRAQILLTLVQPVGSETAKAGIEPQTPVGTIILIKMEGLYP